jgi:acyl-CoA reductase-like NAD-dependent aldehyde dehydrogenase
MECFAAETFGPLVAIEIVDTEDEAVAAANASEFGLNASVFTGSLSRGRRLADRLDAGSVNINDGYRATFGTIDAPQGGMKRSGLGRRNGVEGILRYVEARTVAESTGIMSLPRTGAEWAKMSGLLIVLLKTLKAARLR